MMRRLLLASCALAPVQAWAMSDPARGPLDSRVRTEPYQEMQVVRACSTALAPLLLVLEEGEHPIIAGGLLVSQDQAKATDWYMAEAGNMITLQPLKDMDDVPPSRMMLTIGTLTADKTQRHYQIQLCTRKAQGSSDPDAYMTIQFRYAPVREAADPNAVRGAAARREAMRQAAQEREVMARFSQVGQAPGADPWCRHDGGTMNCEYEKRGAGCPMLTPPTSQPGARKFVWDDGISTKLLWPPHGVVPAVYVLNQDGKWSVQTPINNDTRAGLEVTLPTVYRGIKLVRGHQVCELRNTRYDPIGEQPGGGTGTLSPDVTLQARAAR